MIVNERVETQPQYVRVEVTDELGEAYKDAVNRETGLQGDRFRPIADRLHATAKALAHGREVQRKADQFNLSGIGWKD